jgi:hypothetical protein
MITVIGFVGHTSDQSSPTQCRYFEVDTTVYDSKQTGSVKFTVNCYFTNSRRWENVPLPTTGSLVTVTGKIAGRTDSDNRLAVRVLDQSYLPKATPKSTSNPTVTPTSSKKRADRWGRRVDSTPSKKVRRDSPENSPSPEVQHPHMTHTEEAELDQQLSTAMEEGSNSTAVEEEHQRRSRRKRRQ